MHPQAPYLAPLARSVTLPCLEEAIYRAHFEPGHRNNQQFAKAIFTPNLQSSYDALLPHSDIPLTLIQAALGRAKNDCDLSYLKLVWESKKLPLEDILKALQNVNGPSLRAVFEKKPAEVMETPTSIIQPTAKQQKEEEDPADALLQELLREWESTVTIEEPDENVENPNEEEAEEHASNDVLPLRTPDYTNPWAKMIWMRINGSQILIRLIRKDVTLIRKVEMFVQAHLACVQYIDQCQGENMDIAHLISCYQPLGPSYFVMDRRFATFSPIEYVVRRPDPLQMIQQTYTDFEWNPEILAFQIRTGAFDDYDQGLLEADGVQEWCPYDPDTMHPKTHSLYLAMATILNRIMALLIQMEDRQTPIAHALWVYYASYMELFYVCLVKAYSMDDHSLLNPVDGNYDAPILWLVYGGACATRTFDAYDLPDLMGMISDIPLWGKLLTPEFDLGKMYQKSMPFACQRRHLFRLVKATVGETPSFWPLFSKLCWVMMADLYPGKLASTRQRLSMRDLIRVRELTDSKERMINAFTEGGKDPGGPLVIFTAFRLHILHLAQSDEEYLHQAHECIDWNYFISDTAMLAEIIREHHFFSEDVFAQARQHLSKNFKSSQSHVFRMHRTTLPVNISSQLNGVFKKVILLDRMKRAMDRKRLKPLIDQWTSDQEAQVIWNQTHISKELDVVLEPGDLKPCIEAAYAMCCKAREHYAKVMAMPQRSAILNLILKIPPHLRFTRDAFALLRDPQFGGASEHIMEDMCRLVSIYHLKGGEPKEYATCIGSMLTRDFLVACYYVTMASQLDRISFITLDAETVSRTDYALIHRRHQIAPGQEIDPCMYDIMISLCCKRVATRTGKGRFGNRKVAYDMSRERYVCTHGVSVNKNASANSKSNKHTTSTNRASTMHREDEEDDDSNSDDDIALQEADEDADAEDLAEFEDALGENGKTKKKKKKMRKTKAIKTLTEDEEMRKQIRNECKMFTTIPCGQAVIRYNLRGRALLWRVTAQETVRIQHCPQCGSLHHFKGHGFCGSPDGTYRCDECASLDVFEECTIQCAFCNQNVPVRLIEKHTLLILCTKTEPEDSLQRLVFCEPHFKIARYLSKRGLMTKDKLWDMIENAQQLRASRGKMTTHKL